MHQVIELSQEEQIKMYMRQPKKNLAEMLIECNKLLKMKFETINGYNLSSWECIRCKKIHAFHKSSCDCPTVLTEISTSCSIPIQNFYFYKSSIIHKH